MRPALQGVGFEVRQGEFLGIVGESGSGKSTLAATILRLLPANGNITKGSILFCGKDILQANSEELAKIRGGSISLIFQEPSAALHPTMNIGNQIEEIVSAHESLSARSRREKAHHALSSLFESDVERIYSSYPHQLSGGQRQRVLIAQAIVCQASLIVADEPTTSLDPATQREILSLFQELRQRLGLTLILITHNPALLVNRADRILVLYAGKVVESGPATELLSSPQHPYTRALLQCIPPLHDDGEVARKTSLPVIPGDPPNPSLDFPGCRFEPRCADRMDVCRERAPGEVKLSEAHSVSCFNVGG